MASLIVMGNQKENSADGVGEDIPTDLRVANLTGCLEELERYSHQALHCESCKMSGVG